jgi:hypothetical protein
MSRILPGQGIFARSITLVIFEIILFAGITPLLWIFGTSRSFAVAGAAVGLCTAGALLAIWINHVFCDPKYALVGLLLGMAANMGVPLLSGVTLHLCSKSLSQSGLLYYLAFFYLLTLTLKTCLILPDSDKIKRAKKI